jgi:hypothetical protein
MENLITQISAAHRTIRSYIYINDGVILAEESHWKTSFVSCVQLHVLAY